jgi:hypothetical protein
VLGAQQQGMWNVVSPSLSLSSPSIFLLGVCKVFVTPITIGDQWGRGQERHTKDKTAERLQELAVRKARIRRVHERKTSNTKFGSGEGARID